MTLFERILEARGITSDKKAAFLSPLYNSPSDPSHDPFLLPDMAAAVERLVVAHDRGDRITIYGDYDIDGLTATTLLLDALAQFGFKNVKAFIPNRFVEGYGLTIDAVERIAADGADLILTVDCGSLSHAEIIRAAELGIDVIVTDHHNVAPQQPPAVAVVNPKRLLQDYPEAYSGYILRDQPKAALLAPDQPSRLYSFLDLPGVGVAFKLVQALQTRLSGLPYGQEKWLLDLVALGTVCDVVTLQDENRSHVYWGLKVLAKTRRPGLKALMAVSGVQPLTLNARSLGFGLGPRMNAAGRLETAQYSLDMLTSDDPSRALALARKLDTMNQARRKGQDEIFQQAVLQAEDFASDPVLVVAAEGWNHGIVGIVAAKLLEKYHKPTYVLAIDGARAKGSARSYGDFSAADAIRSADDIITKGGGHKLAAGVTLPTAKIDDFRRRVNNFYSSLKLKNQPELLLPKADAKADLSEVTLELVNDLAQLEPFGSGNLQPILQTASVKVMGLRRMGDSGQHLKITVQASSSSARIKLDLLAFNAPDYFFVEIGQQITVWYAPEANDWQGRRTVEGRLLHMEIATQS